MRFLAQLFCIGYAISIANLVSAQEIKFTLNVGDSAPPLYLSEWIKGTPIERLENDKVYMVEFWATWCKPCLQHMPQISKLAHKYREEVTTISVNVYERKGFPRQRAREIIDSFGRKIDYSVVFEDSNKMFKTWASAAWDGGLPSVFIVKEGKISWIGYPTEADTVLPQILNNRWDVQFARNKADYDYCMYLADQNAREEYFRFYRDNSPSDFYGQPDSALFYIRQEVGKEPDLEYAFNTVFHKFEALLKVDTAAAYEYAKSAVNPRNLLGPQVQPVLWGISNLSEQVTISPKIYLLGAALIEEYYPTSVKYLMIASEWYWRAGDKANTSRCLKRTRKLLKRTTPVGGGFFY